MNRVKTLLPYLLVTLLCVAGVELFYDSVKKKLRIAPKSGADSRVVAEGVESTEENLDQEFDYQVIVDRNLFGSSSGPVVETENEEASPDDMELTSLDIILLGTISGDSNGRRAFIVDKSTNEQEVYQKGDAVQGAIIKDILRGKIVLNYQGNDEVLHMSTDKDTGSQGGEAVNPSPRKRRILPAPAQAMPPGGNVNGDVQTAPPKRRFSFKKRTNPEPESESEPEPSQ